MSITRSLACAAAAAAVAAAVVLPAQAGLAATASPSALAAGSASSSWTAAGTRSASAVQGGSVGDTAGSDGDDDTASGDDSGSDDVQVVDGTDAPEDDTDVLAGDSGSSGSAARRGTTSGKWARIARPTAVRATLTAGSRARVTWRAGAGGVLAQRFVVQLRAGGSVLQTTTFSSARSATFWSLASAKRYTVTVTAVAADGTRKAAVGGSLRTPAAAKPVRPVRTASQAAAAAKADARHAKAASLR